MKWLINRYSRFSMRSEPSGQRFSLHSTVSLLGRLLQGSSSYISSLWLQIFTELNWSGHLNGSFRLPSMDSLYLTLIPLPHVTEQGDQSLQISFGHFRSACNIYSIFKFFSLDTLSHIMIGLKFGMNISSCVSTHMYLSGDQNWLTSGGNWKYGIFKFILYIHIQNDLDFKIPKWVLGMYFKNCNRFHSEK